MNMKTTYQIPRGIINQVKNLLITTGQLTVSQSEALSDKRVQIIACLSLLPHKLQDQWLSKLDNHHHLLARLIHTKTIGTTTQSLKDYLKFIQAEQHQLKILLNNVIQHEDLIDRKINGLSNLFN